MTVSGDDVNNAPIEKEVRTRTTPTSEGSYTILLS